jgi:vitamin B12 transporter
MFGPYDADFLGARVKADYQGSFEATDRILFQYGLDHELQNAKTSDDFAETDASFSLTGLWAQSVVEPVDNLFLTGGLRHDEHSEFGGHTTYRGTVAYLFEATATRLHSSFGTGFRAPSLYELYAPFYGDSSLQPETSISFDLGVGQEFLDGRLVTDLTYFMIDIDDLIEFDTAASRYRQVPGTTRSRGVEASFSFAATDEIALGGSYTYTDSKTDAGERSVQVPLHAVVLSAAWRPDEQWTLSGDAKFVVDTVGTGNVELEDYVLVNAKLAYRYNEGMEFYVRGENLLDQHYQTVAGYGTPGLSVFTGIEARF